MKNNLWRFCFVIMALFQINNVFAWGGMPMPQLHVEGRYLKDPQGNTVNLHGFAQTYSPWFNEQGKYWSNYNVAGCLNYNKGIIDGVMAAGWKVNFIRLHMDPYWSNTPGRPVTGENDISAFSFDRFKMYLNNVFVPMAEYAISKGLYVIMRPPGVCPEKIAVGDAYNQYLIKVWGYVAQHPKLKNHPNIMFELANEPVNILGTDGTYGAGSQGHFDNLKKYFQAVVDTIRSSADNILWIPGLGYQSLYQGYAVNPIEGENIGYAVHVYPGWFNSGQGYDSFQRGWDNQVKPVADFAPIVVTEMDWAPEKYNSSWGKDVTGTAGGSGFGANFKKITDDAGNVSWLIFTGPDLLDGFKDTPPAAGQSYTFLTDPEACPWPTYHWYQEYAQKNYPRPDFVYQSTSDNGDGTFNNPILYGDFPDPVTVKVDDTYYMVSSTPATTPNTTIVKSKDLINWEYSNIPIDSIPLNDKKLVKESDIHSGTMVQTSSGEWWATVSYNKGPFGNFVQLVPVAMINNKPVTDISAIDAIKISNPNVGRDYAPTSLATNDIFRNYKLGLQWNWNREVDYSKWSLMERAGYMRLRTTNVVDNLNTAKNILTQRILAYPKDLEHSYGTIRMEINHMNEGDVAGLSVFQKSDGYIGVKMINGEKKLVAFINNEMQTGSSVTDTVIYLRAVANYKTSKARFYYSFDGTTFSELGNDMIMENDLSVSTGYKFGIFNFATAAIGGYVDIDWFSTENTFSEDKFYDSNFAGYTEKSLTLSEINVDGRDNLTLLTSSSVKLAIQAVFADGHTEDISAVSKCTNNNPDIVAIVNGQLIARKDGQATLTIDYTGPLGEQKQATLYITSTTFPLKNNLLNPNIFGSGTFNETTRTLKTGQWGFGGWQYGGIDLSGYNYIIAKLGSNNTAGVEFKLFDENNYWAASTTTKFGNTREVIVNLKTIKKSNGTPLNPSHIYIAGFWSNGSAPFIIDQVFLSNSPTGINDLPDMVHEPEIVDVYTIMGVRIRSQVKREQATLGLSVGVYIVGNKKVIITGKK